MKKRSLAGNVGIGIFSVGFICICVAFFTSSWVVSDPRITNSRLETIGLWRQCFKSLPDPVRADAPKRYFAGCRWVYDPFTTGYSELIGFLLPPFMIATQFFATLCFLACVISLGLIILYSTCYDPEQKYYLRLIMIIALLQIFGSISGCIAVIIFAMNGNKSGWMPGHENNYFGWSFALGVIGSILGLIAGILFYAELYIQKKKRKHLKESQSRFPLQS
ncbi:uncharacterized protein LOC106651501 [Trichogramma pretiosum]|uniref:uncharacterized protein LOC106651501 n=1 Tax=Trichogramma pretiosum TaxID=7493 RepID=UPI0006C987DD|nr:uncharacterized protein LOC106651501 [Trichogramma pretiosum]